MKKNPFMVLCVLMMAAVLLQCGSKKSQDYPRFDAGDNQLLNYGFSAVQNPSVSLAANVTGTISSTQVSLQVPYGTNVSSLVAEFVTNSTNVKVGDVVQKSGVTANDFTKPVVYSVFNNLGVNQDYTVTVTVAPSNEKKFISFAINGTNGAIDESAGTISIDLPPGTNASSLAATFSAVAKSVTVKGAAQTTGVTKNDFTGSVIYTVTAEDASTKNYTVTAKVLPAPWKDITSFTFLKSANPLLSADVNGTISGSTIQLILPYGLSPADLVATFSTEAKSVTVDSLAQKSGVTHNDFTHSCQYHSIAEDGTSRDYTVTVTVAKNSAKVMSAYSISGVSGTFTGNAISLTLPYGTDLSALIASFTMTGDSVTVNGTAQKSGITVTSFTSPVDYIVTAADGTTSTYTVTVSLAKNDAKAITSYSINGMNGTISGNAISLTLPYGTDLTALVATFTTSGESVSVDGTVQTSATTSANFTGPVVYTVTASNGTTAVYTVNVAVAKNSAKAITAYSLSGVSGTISGNAINLTVPFGTDTSALVATYSTTGESVAVRGAVQTSGVTANNFATPVVYTVTAADGTTSTYTVNLAVAKSDAKTLTKFSIDSDTGVIDESAKTITVQVAASKIMTSRAAVFTSTGVSVKVNGAEQTSGVTANNFTSAVQYLVTADNGSTAVYTVTITRSSELIGQWNFENTSDGSFTNSGATVVAGTNGTALQFDGFTSYVSVPDSDSLTLASAGSLETYIKVISHRFCAGVVHKGTKTDFSDEAYSLQFWGGDPGSPNDPLRFSIFSESGAYEYVDSATKLADGEWYHIVATWDETKISLYINGRLDVSTPNTAGKIRKSDGALIIGAQLDKQYYSGYGNLGFNGVIEGVNVFNRVLTDAEIASRYTNYNSGGTGLGAYLMSAASRNVPLIIGFFILIALGSLYLYNRKRARAEKQG